MDTGVGCGVGCGVGYGVERGVGCGACRGDDVRRQQLAVQRLERARLNARRAQLQAAADVEPAQRGAAAAQLLERGVAEARAAGEADLRQVRPWG